MAKIKMHPVTSSNIQAIGYDHGSRTLQIQFINKPTSKNPNPSTSIYQYFPITEICYNEFDQAESKGKYFHENIKSNQNVTCIKLQ